MNDDKVEHVENNTCAIALKTDSPSLNRAFRIALGDIQGNIVPFMSGLLNREQPCLLAGLDYRRPWTRDSAVNADNGLALIYPQVVRATLMSALSLNEEGPVIGGQYWDAVIWAVGAWTYFRSSGDDGFLRLARQALCRTLQQRESTEFSGRYHLFRGPACYGDGVSAYPDLYARTNGKSGILEWPACNPDLCASKGYGIPMYALSTNCLYVAAYRILADMFAASGMDGECWRAKANRLTGAINGQFWDEKRGTYRYLVDEFGGCDHEEALGTSFAMLFGIAGTDRARRLLQNQTLTSAGIPCVSPAFKRYRLDADSYGRHSGTVWPHIQGFWADAAVRHDRFDLFDRELSTLVHAACRDNQFTEIYHPVSGLPYGGLQENGSSNPVLWRSCARQSWSATALLRMVLFGMLRLDLTSERLIVRPRLPDGMKTLTLQGLRYRGAVVTIRAMRVDTAARSGSAPVHEDWQKGKGQVPASARGRCFLNVFVP